MVIASAAKQSLRILLLYPIVQIPGSPDLLAVPVPDYVKRTSPQIPERINQKVHESGTRDKTNQGKGRHNMNFGKQRQIGNGGDIRIK